MYLKELIIVIIFSFSMVNLKSQSMIIDLSGMKISDIPDSLFEKADQITELNLGSTGELFAVIYPEVRPMIFGTEVRNEFKELTS
ncbi:MAG: hypothetical protein O9262_05795, partial [Cyclobacteriaceae bacterium]|nr:hypothetical protein [Cyclobacteriaceae bacterium]